jgi:transcriptional regulator with XRE-family HTH domain
VKAKHSDFGGRLRYYTANAGVTSGQLAQLMGVKAETASRWLQGKMMPKDQELLRLAQLLKVEVNLLVPGFAPPEARTTLAVRRVEDMTEDAGFDPATAEPAQVLRVAGYWFAELIKNDRDAALSHQWLQRVFEAGKRAAASEGKKSDVG